MLPMTGALITMSFARYEWEEKINEDPEVIMVSVGVGLLCVL